MEVNKRLVTPQDITWFLDLNDRGRLDLDPPYQRKSVWSIKDRRYFLNTIFSNYPTPALFVHRTMEGGKATYHIVDGKQRLETIIRFATDRIRLGDEFEDVRLDKKKFSELGGDLKDIFWNYQLIVEQLTSAESNYIREIFDRVNRNTRKLTRQEIRHARFDGWFASRVDSEAEGEATIWRQFGIVTAARARRMADAQFIAEIMILTITQRVLGFDQDMIDVYYSDYDDPSQLESEFDVEQFERLFGDIKEYLTAMVAEVPEVTENARTATHFYSLWAILTTERGRLPEARVLADRYSNFMRDVYQFNMENLVTEASAEGEGVDRALPPAVRYYLNAQAAPTDLGPRLARHEALRRGLLNDESATGPEDSVSGAGNAEPGAEGTG